MKSQISNFQFRIWFGIAALALLVVVTTTPVGAYVTTRELSTANQIVQNRWKSFPITWRMNPTRGSNVTGTREQADVFRASFAAWQAVSTAAVSFTEGSATAATVKPAYDQINLITTNISASEYGSGALGVAAVYSFQEGGANFVDEFNRPIEFAGQIIEADIMFNPATAFTTEASTVSGRVDLQTVATHEVGHILGLDHTTLVSSTMFPTIGSGLNYGKTLSADDIAGISSIYPSATFATKGRLSGSVRTTSNVPVYGAIVVAVNASGQPVASAITNPSGAYTIEGLDAGAYTVYAEPMDQPFTISNVATLTRIYAGQSTNSSFTTRYR